MSSIVTTKRSGGSKQFTPNPPTFKFYQTKDDVVFEPIYWDSTSYTYANVVTGTNTIVNTSLPLAGDLYETVWNPTDTSSSIPLVGTQRGVRKISAAANNDGGKYTVSLDVSGQNYFVIVLKSGQTSTAGKISIKSSVGNQYNLTFTTSATANTWEAKKFAFKESGSAGVSAPTGTPVATGITEIEITLDALNTDVSVALTYFTQNSLQIIGSALSFSFSCLSTASMTRNLNTADFICGQLVAGKTATSDGLDFTMTTQKQNILQLALSSGSVPKTSSVYIKSKLATKTVSAGAITVPSGLVLLRVLVDGKELQGTATTAALVDSDTYFYTSTTITVSTEYNGKSATIEFAESTSKPNFDLIGLSLGYVGWMILPRKMANGNYTYDQINKVQLNTYKMNFGDVDEVEFGMTVIPDSDGKMLTHID